MDPLTIIFGLLQVFGGLSKANAQRQAEYDDAHAMEIEGERSKIEAAQRHNDRMLEFQEVLSTNIAQITSQGRDPFQDRSVKAFLAENERRATMDISRVDFMGDANATKMKNAATSKRKSGDAFMVAGILGAAGTLVSTQHQINLTRVAEGG